MQCAIHRGFFVFSKVLSLLRHLVTKKYSSTSVIVQAINWMIVTIIQEWHKFGFRDINFHHISLSTNCLHMVITP